MHRQIKVLMALVPILMAALTACGRATPQATTSTFTIASIATPKPSDTHTPTMALSPTPKPHNVPPVIVLKPVGNASPHQRVILDASGTFDYDDDAITFAWSQLHNPDRYTGTEYITGNNATLETSDSSITAFIPDWPGVYRFTVTATDKDSTSSQTIDVVVRPTTIVPIRGVSMLWWYGNSSNDSFVQVLNRLVADGVNWVELVPYWCQESLGAIEVHPCDPQTLEPMTDKELRTAIQQAHASGMKVLVKPHIYVPTWQAMWQIHPSDWDTWFTSYTAYMVYMARLAEEEKVEMFSVGNELASTHSQEENWRALIREVRKVFFGQLTYSDLCIQRAKLCPQGFPAWDQLDLIGVSFYFNGTCSPQWGCQTPGEQIPASTNPSVAIMTDEIDRQIAATVDPLQRKYGLPVIATEIGLENVDGANYEPAGSDSKVIDNQEQADWYEAALQATSRHSYWQGYFFGGVDPLPKPFVYDGTVPDKTGDPRFKPAEQVLALWFGA